MNSEGDNIVAGNKAGEQADSDNGCKDAKEEREKWLQAFLDKLREEEKSAVTMEKYRRDVRCFLSFSENKELSKENSMAYKAWLFAENYKVASINSMLAAMNGFLSFIGREDCRIHPVKTQNRVYAAQSEELTIEEYERLIRVAEPNEKMVLLLQTLAGTGIRISELDFFTREAIQSGEIEVRCKNKMREILLPQSLQTKLLEYAKVRGVESGPIFQTSGGRALNRTNIWRSMKRLCKEADVAPEKVYPHNFRKLFARTVYQADKDLAMLADLLGHSSLNTTRIYIKTTGKEHRERIEKTNLVPGIENTNRERL